MFRKILFIFGLPKTIYRIGSEMLESATPLQTYEKCLRSMPKSARYYLGPWFEALYKQDEEGIAREAERLWNEFKRSPLVRMVVNLTFYINFAWTEKFRLCDLFTMTLNIKRWAFLFKKVPDPLLYYEFTFICDFFSGTDNIQLFIYQLPADEHGQRMKERLMAVLRTAKGNTDEKVEAMGKVLEEAKEWGELKIVSLLIEILYIRDKVLEVNGISPTGGKWIQEFEKNNICYDESEWEAC